MSLKNPVRQAARLLYAFCLLKVHCPGLIKVLAVMEPRHFGEIVSNDEAKKDPLNISIITIFESVLT